MPDEDRERLSLADGSAVTVAVAKASKEELGSDWMNAIKTFASCFHAELLVDS